MNHEFLEVWLHGLHDPDNIINLMNKSEPVNNPEVEFLCKGALTRPRLNTKASFQIPVLYFKSWR